MQEETSQVEQSNAADTHSYKGWLNSDSFLKRVFAVLGYAMVGQFILSAVLMCIMVVLMLMFGGLIS